MENLLITDLALMRPTQRRFYVVMQRFHSSFFLALLQGLLLWAVLIRGDGPAVLTWVEEKAQTLLGANILPVELWVMAFIVSIILILELRPTPFDAFWMAAPAGAFGGLAIWYAIEHNYPISIRVWFIAGYAAIILLNFLAYINGQMSTKFAAMKAECAAKSDKLAVLEREKEDLVRQLAELQQERAHAPGTG